MIIVGFLKTHDDLLVFGINFIESGFELVVLLSFWFGFVFDFGDRLNSRHRSTLDSITQPKRTHRKLTLDWDLCKIT